MRHRPTLHALLFLLSLTGCLTAMASAPESATKHRPPNHFPLTFKRHDFAAYCYNTIGCEVIYAGHNFTSYYSGDVVASPPPSADYRQQWNPAGYLGIQNFPPPAKVTWRSLDGTIHKADVDIAGIFRDELVRYTVPNEEVRAGAFPGPGPSTEPSIYLEVNDRTVSVFMRAFIPTTELQIPGNRYSDARTDLVMAWTQSY